MDTTYDWDQEKAEFNFKKHGISFEEASTVFADENAILGENFYSTFNEKRDIIIGLSKKRNLLFVVYETDDEGSWVKIISAREAKGKLKQSYWSQF